MAQRIPLGEIEPAEIEAFWNRFLTATNRPEGTTAVLQITDVRVGALLGIDFGPEMATVFQRFDVVYQED